MQAGMLSSSLESGVPEQMFSTPTQPAQGVSAVKALQIASSQGQRIYHITRANQADVLPKLRLNGLALQEISQGLASGREVIAHTDRINVSGWTGEGYIIYDPYTGSGAYKITGGSNGGLLIFAVNAGLMFALNVILGLIPAAQADSGGGDSANKDFFDLYFSAIKEAVFWLFEHVKNLVKFSNIIQVLDYMGNMKAISDMCNGPLFLLGAMAYTVLTASFFTMAIMSTAGLMLLLGLIGILVSYLALKALEYECSQQAYIDRRRSREICSYV